MNARAGLWPATRPLVKWTGGKGAELARISACMPTLIDRYIEPFLGGGAVLFSLHSSISAEVNDTSQNLVDLYRCQATLDPDLLRAMHALDKAWVAVDEIPRGLSDRDAAALAGLAGTLLNFAIGPGFSSRVREKAMSALARKRKSILRLAQLGRKITDPSDLLASALKSSVYEAVREAFNAEVRGPRKAAMFWFLRDFCYGGMFRNNASGGFNVPYGGISYDSRSVGARILQLEAGTMRDRLSGTRFHNLDFEDFFALIAPRPGDFVFLDPPYDSPFSTYDGRSFGRSDHLRLAGAMAKLPCPWMMVISANDFIRKVYADLPGVQTSESQKQYKGGIKGRYLKSATHLMIANYDLTSPPGV